MKLTLAEPSYLKDSIAIISELVNEARFKVSKNGLELVAMDPANVAMVIFKLLSSAFTEYNIKEDIELSINLNNLKQILRRAKANDAITLELEESKLKIQLKSNTTRTFNLPIIDIEEKEQKIPELKFPVHIEMPCSILNEAVEDASIVAESMALEAEPKKLNILAEGDLSQVKVEIKEEDNVKITVQGTSKIRSKYSIEYLKKMMGASKLSEKVDVHFNKDYPLKLDYKELDKVSLSFVLAPRVEND
ncbi:proliferating cell nuclear antigen (pcna) [Candidatus Woesearchaeota archaeon]|nr:proliferating cell nuclear antigen (pcna) [Candidatus Woesearchaeota archaeon]